MDKNKLKEYANKLMFDMNEEEYETLSQEFAIILKQMELIDGIEGLSLVEPMTFPYLKENITLRDDEVKSTLEVSDVLKNSKLVEENRIKVPKVVE
ncbi:MAG: Asp-tRNA(Asn)/Glu-tRNA(Gln) amidotransferase subunit GatC [Bacilli bacterium]|nr:Asp-tRNA(Asn)/Glu-tRNA(Gln) amidotransferase subunit GatC [Bacilli bacterium]